MNRICFVDFNFYVLGGVEMVLAQLANDLADTCEVHILSLCAGEGELPYALDPRIRFTALNEGAPRIRRLIVSSFRPLLRYFRENRIEVALLMGNYQLPVVLPVRPFTRTKLVFCDHGAIVNEREKRFITFFRRLAARMCPMTVTLTERNRRDYVELFHIPERKLRAIPNCIPQSIWDRASEHYDPASRKILSAGRFGPEKGYDLMVRAAEKALPRCPGWIWEIYGDGETLPQIRQALQDRGLQDRVLLKGRTDRLPELYREYALLVLPSYREGLPLTLLEAKANRLPIVSFDVATGPAEIVADGVNGFLVSPYDTDAMADRLVTLMTDEDLRCRFSENSRLWTERFDRAAVLQRWRELIGELSAR